MEINTKDLERVIVAGIAKDVLAMLPQDKISVLLEASLDKTLTELLKPWNVEKAIQSDVNRYMAEYLKQQDVQDRIKKATETKVDELMDGVIHVIICAAQDTIKSDYKKFIEKEKEKEKEKK